MTDVARLRLPGSGDAVSRRRSPEGLRGRATAAVAAVEVAPAAAVPGRGFDMLLLLAPLIGATLLAKLSVPPFGERGLAVSVGIPLAVAAVAALGARLRIAADRAAWLLAASALLFGIALLRSEAFSVLSLLLFAVLHLPYAFELRDGEALRRRAMQAFLVLAAVIALFGIAQIGMQFVLPLEFAFPIENFAPKGWIVQAFNQQGPIDFGADLYRANGLVMLEPSFFSQLLAVAIVAELCGRNRKGWLALFALALVLSYSGTGVLVLLLALPVLVVARARFGLLLAAALAVLVLIGVAEALDFDLFAKRAAEIANPGSSGFARFVGGFYLWDQFLWHEPLRALFGYGAGSFERYQLLASYPVAGMALTKMVFEFGVLGGLAYFGFLFYCVFSAPAPLALRVAIAATFLLSGNYIGFAHGLALSLLMWSAATNPPLRATAPASRTRLVATRGALQ